MSLTHGSVCTVSAHTYLTVKSVSYILVLVFCFGKTWSYVGESKAWQTCCAWFAKYLIYNIVSCEVFNFFLTIFRFSKYPRCQSKRLFTQHNPAKCCKKQVFFLEHKTCHSCHSLCCTAWISVHYVEGNVKGRTFFFFFENNRPHRRPTRMVEMTRERFARESVMFIPFRFGTSVMLRPPDALHFPTCGRWKVCS